MVVIGFTGCERKIVSFLMGFEYIRNNKRIVRKVIGIVFIVSCLVVYGFILGFMEIVMECVVV